MFHIIWIYTVLLRIKRIYNTNILTFWTALLRVLNMEEGVWWYINTSRYKKIIMQSYSDCFHSNDFFNLTYDDVCWIQLADLHVTYINMFNVKMSVLYWFKEFSFNSFYRFNFVSTFLFLFSETFIQFLLFNTYRITI